MLEDGRVRVVTWRTMSDQRPNVTVVWNAPRSHRLVLAGQQDPEIAHDGPIVRRHAGSVLTHRTVRKRASAAEPAVGDTTTRYM